MIGLLVGAVSSDSLERTRAALSSLAVRRDRVVPHTTDRYARDK